MSDQIDRLAENVSKLVDTVAIMEVRYARFDEKLIRMIDDKQRMDITINKLVMTVDKLKTAAAITGLYNSSWPKIVMIALAGVGLGFSIHEVMDVAATK